MNTHFCKKASDIRVGFECTEAFSSGMKECCYFTRDHNKMCIHEVNRYTFGELVTEDPKLALRLAKKHNFMYGEFRCCTEENACLDAAIEAV